MFNNPLGTPNAKLGERAKELYEKYFSDTGKYNLNLDDEIASKIHQKMNDNQIDRDMFLEAQRSVFFLMETACVSQFFADFCKKELEGQKQNIKANELFGSAKRLGKQKTPAQLSTESLNLETFFNIRRIE